MTRLPAISVADLLAAESGWLSRIKLAYGAGTAGFERDLLPLVQRYARCVHFLPAAASGAFSRPGGLFQLGLQIAFFALQGTDSRIFAGQAHLSTRQALEPRWRLATFIGGLCSEWYRVADRITVRDPAGAGWPPLLSPLADWLAERQAPEFLLRWTAPRQGSRGLGLFLLPQVVPAELLQHLASGNDLVLPHLLASIGGVPVFPEHNVLDALVRRSLALCIERDDLATAGEADPGDAATHVIRELLDAMRQLARSDPAWVVNRDKSRLWWGADGAYLVWPGAAEDVRRELEAASLNGMPKSSESMAQVLVKSGAIEPSAQGTAIWSIQPPGTRSAVAAVRLNSPALLGLDGGGQAPLPTRLAPIESPPAPERPAPSSPSIPSASPPVEPPEPTAPAAGGMQLPLLQDEPEATVVPDTEPVAGGARPWSLDAPLRLNPSVRQAVVSVLNSVAMRPQVEAALLAAPAGGPLFVPLSALDGSGQAPAVVLRALRESGMLHIEPGSPPTVVRRIDGQAVPGLLLPTRFVRLGADTNANAEP
ncbi:MobH family relaxase [Sphaerotilus microaerophilus]|uniref:MobH family relaxase n=1 Tax=Sphaerotilus microaerophilus TaxID=2914710 RepID=UPI002872C4A5|nr:MobH family relaxase [Sphaerotilus sp. FB-5]